MNTSVIYRDKATQGNDTLSGEKLSCLSNSCMHSTSCLLITILPYEVPLLSWLRYVILQELLANLQPLLLENTNVDFRCMQMWSFCSSLNEIGRKSAYIQACRHLEPCMHKTIRCTTCVLALPQYTISTTAAMHADIILYHL